MCLFYQNILLFPSFPSHSRSALCLKPVVPSVSSVCVCLYAPGASEGKSILCKLESEQEKKSRGWQGAEGWGRGRSGMEMVLCACAHVCVRERLTASVCLCVWASAPELQSQPLIWPLPGNVSVLWFDTVCVCVCELESGWYHQFLYWKHTVRLEPSKCYLVCRGGKSNGGSSKMSLSCRCDVWVKDYLIRT